MVAQARRRVMMAFVVAVVPSAVLTGQLSESARARASAAVVMIRAQSGGGSVIGAGVIVAASAHSIYIATAGHLFRSATQTTINVQFAARPGKWFRAELIDRREPALDLLLIAAERPPEVDVSALSELGAAHGSTLTYGSDVYPMGFPGERPWAVPPVSDKVDATSALTVRFQSQFVRPGNSGGALLDRCGRIVGMVTAIDPPEATAVRIELLLETIKGWSLPVSVALKLSTAPCGATSTSTSAAKEGKAESGVGLTNSRGNESIDPDAGGGWVRIRAGAFQMGCVRTSGETCEDNNNGENPRHLVRLTRDFFIMDKEVTVGSFRRVAVMKNIPFLPQHNPSGDDYPVANVSWSDAMAYCSAVGATLPTEAQWEYAARAGKDGLAYPWGNSFEWGRANVTGRTYDLWESVAPVGSFAPNDWGLYDMIGNLMEWTFDWNKQTYYAQSPQDDPKGPDAPDPCCIYKSIRGGYFGHSPQHVRSHSRFAGKPEERDPSKGFRCVKEVR